MIKRNNISDEVTETIIRRIEKKNIDERVSNRALKSILSVEMNYSYYSFHTTNVDMFILVHGLQEEIWETLFLSENM